MWDSHEDHHERAHRKHAGMSLVMERLALVALVASFVCVIYFTWFR